ncbi:hypothetical protein BF49_6885 [Bradyrhizobium sp.]|nr:hypothetical protein BF49_6885 [Bradyrhizobium sp.]
MEFATEAACLNARKAVYAQAEELRQHELKFAKAKAEVSGMSERLLVASVQLPNVTAACVTR